jgi:hypothetical protein
MRVTIWVEVNGGTGPGSREVKAWLKSDFDRNFAPLAEFTIESRLQKSTAPYQWLSPSILSHVSVH